LKDSDYFLFYFFKEKSMNRMAGVGFCLLNLFLLISTASPAFKGSNMIPIKGGKYIMGSTSNLFF